MEAVACGGSLWHQLRELTLARELAFGARVQDLLQVSESVARACSDSLARQNISEEEEQWITLVASEVTQIAAELARKLDQQKSTAYLETTTTNHTSHDP